MQYLAPAFLAAWCLAVLWLLYRLLEILTPLPALLREIGRVVSDSAPSYVRPVEAPAQASPFARSAPPAAEEPVGYRAEVKALQQIHGITPE